MAISLAFGVLFSTAVTLLLVPVGYLILEEATAWWALPWRRRTAGVRGGSAEHGERSADEADAPAVPS